MGQKIAEARGRAGLTQSDLASRIQLDRSALAKIELGSRRVSALELAKIADVLNERIEWFVMETPNAIVSHRNSLDSPQQTSRIDRKIEEIAWNVEFLLGQTNALQLPSVETFSHPETVKDAEAMASSVRAVLQLGKSDPFYEIAESFNSLGLLTFSFDLAQDSPDAASILLARGGVALINGHLHVGRRRLALAHELGHYLVADEYNVDWRIDQHDDDAIEHRLDYFARALLLPMRGIVDDWHSLRQAGDSIRVTAVKLASKYRVDMSTLARRLRDVDCVTHAEANQVRSARTTRADIVELNLVTRDELAPPYMSRSYEKAVVHLYRQETISPARATDLLFDIWEEDDLPPLPNLPESAAWDFV